MDKAKFVQTAPAYYALAILWYLSTQKSITSANDIKNYYRNNELRRLQHQEIFDAAIRWLEERKALEVSQDEFAPSIFEMVGDASEIWSELEADRGLPFYKFAKTGNSLEWLYAALSNINITFEKLEIADDDFSHPDDNWAPLPLDRSDQELQSAIESLDDVIEQIRADNGYNASFPEERNYVLDGLSSASRTLKQATSTSAPYIQKYLLEPLAIVLRRFKDATISIAATAAKDAVIEYLKKHGAEWLAKIFS